jgi:hypothetical protein
VVLTAVHDRHEVGNHADRRAFSDAQRSAPDILLAAAHTSEADKCTSGAYWKVRTLHTIPVMVGSGANSYTLAERRVIETWTPRDGGTALGWYGVRSMGARPASAADEVAWRRDGSPTTWDIGPLDAPGQPHRLLTLNRTDNGSLTRVHGRSAPFALAEGITLTQSQLHSLPTDPTLLKRRLLTLQKQTDFASGPDQWLFVTAAALVSDMPTPPHVRSAAFRVLAALPSIHSAGGDSVAGRKTVRLTHTPGARGATVDLLMDPASSKLLTKTSYSPKGDVTVVLSSGWTDEAPHVPSAETSASTRP